LARFYIGAGEKRMRQCRNCGKEIPDNLAYCNEACLREHMKKKRESKKKIIRPVENDGNSLKKIYDSLDLNDAKDGRLIIKADIMKKVILLTAKWKSGKKREWVDKLSIFTCVSTRKIREDYIQPLITVGILAEFGDNIKFVGSPKMEASF
jgi:hypothetical protein